jgi:hypothetical protein
MKPKCGFCNKEIKLLSSGSNRGITLFCCSECGAVLGISRDLDFTVVSCEDIKDDENSTEDKSDKSDEPGC